MGRRDTAIYVGRGRGAMLVEALRVLASVWFTFCSGSFALCEEGAREEMQAASSAIMESLSKWQPEPAPHPNVLIASEDLAAWRKRAADAPAFFDQTRQQAEAALAAAPSESARTCAYEALVLAITGLIDGREDMSRAALARIRRALAEDTWVMAAHVPLKVDLGYSGTAYCLAQAYDWIWPLLTDEERREIAEALGRRLKFYEEIAFAESEWWTKALHNWRSVICGEMGVVALCLRDTYPTWRSALEVSLRGVFEAFSSLDADGAYPEGLSYWGYGVGQGAWFCAALKQVSGGAVDPFEHPFLQKTGDFALYLSTPDGGSFGFEDCASNVSPNGWLVYLLAREMKRPDLQWLANTVADRSLASFLFADLALTAEPPEGDPGRYFPSIETVTCRSGWAPGSTFLGFHAGKTVVNHAHLDIGTFTLIARGEELVGDAGIWPYDHSHLFFNSVGPRWDYEANATIGHNTVLVDGKGQVFGHGNEGHVTAVNFGQKADTIVCDGTSAYGGRLSRFIRYAAFLKPDVVVLVDDLAAAEAAQFAWLLHPRGNLHKENTHWRAAGEKAVLDVTFLGFDDLEAGTGHRVGMADRSTYYRDRNGTPVQRSNRCVSFETLHAVKDWLVPVVLTILDPAGPEAATAQLTRDEHDVTVAVAHGAWSWTVRVNLAERSIAVE